MGDTIPNCEFMHAHEEIIEKVKNALKKRWRNMNNISKGDSTMNQLAARRNDLFSGTPFKTSCNSQCLDRNIRISSTSIK